MSSESVDGVVVDGVAPEDMAAPGSRDELVDAVNDAATAGRVLGVAGAGTKLDRGHPPSSLDLLIRTTGLDRIVEHAAGDLVVTVEPGVRLADLQDALIGSGQWLALDPPEPDATVGGVVAAAASGPRRLRWGTPRDLVIGMTVVLADGTVARSGGKVVKNVAGYDLGKLFTGSFGTLGIIAEITLRLHPRPRSRAVVTATPDDAAAAVRSVRAGAAQPTAIEWDGSTLTVLIEGSPAAVDAQAADLAGRLEGEAGADLPEGFGELPWQRRAGESRRQDAGRVGLKLTHRLGALDQALAAADRILPQARLRAHAGSGVIWLGHDEGHLDGLAALRREFAALDGQVVVVEAPPAAKADVDVWGPVRGLDVMRRIKEQFDPERRMSPGRFAGGL